MGSLRQFLHDIGDLHLSEVGLLHNNFVSGEQAVDHNAVFGDDFHATPSNVFETSPSNIDPALLSDELTEIASISYPFPVRINPRLIAPGELGHLLQKTGCPPVATLRRRSSHDDDRSRWRNHSCPRPLFSFSRSQCSRRRSHQLLITPECLNLDSIGTKWRIAACL